jgi:hypothetical protein
MGLIDEKKTKSRKSRATVPLSNIKPDGVRGAQFFHPGTGAGAAPIFIRRPMYAETSLYCIMQLLIIV